MRPWCTMNKPQPPLSSTSHLQTPSTVDVIDIQSTKGTEVVDTPVVFLSNNGVDGNFEDGGRDNEPD